MDTITPASALVVVIAVILVSALVLHLQKKREKTQYVPIDINHYFDPQTNRIVQIHK